MDKVVVDCDEIDRVEEQAWAAIREQIGDQVAGQVFQVEEQVWEQVGRIKEQVWDEAWVAGRARSVTS